MRVRPAGLASAVCALGVFPGAAQAIAPCPGVSTAVTPVLAGQGVLESVIIDARGRLYYTDTTAKQLRRLEAPGAKPETVASGVDAPGGLAIDDRGRILLGQGCAGPRWSAPTVWRSTARGATSTRHRRSSRPRSRGST